MTLQTLKLAGKPYVLLPENEFRKLMDRLSQHDAEERIDAVIVRKRLKNRQPLIPLAQVKKELGL
jgi:hypothetical protein